MAETYRLELDGDGDVWLKEDDEARCEFRARLLGKPREELYEVVPAELWPVLEGFIAERADGIRYGRAYVDGIHETYERSRFR